jgi:hypothetical protein
MVDRVVAMMSVLRRVVVAVVVADTTRIDRREDSSVDRMEVALVALADATDAADTT